MAEDFQLDTARWLEDLEAARFEEAAAAQLLEVYRPYLLALANEQVPPLVRAKEAASDIVQETIVRALREIGSFRGSDSQAFVGWLRQILMNKIVDKSRHWLADKRNVACELSLDQGDSGHNWANELVDAAPPPDLSLLKLEEMRDVNRVLEQLPSHFVQAILLRSRDKRSFDEIGQILGRSAEAARKLWLRGMKELQRRLSHD